MATYFIVSDVHSFYNELQEALSNAGFDINNKNHIFVSLGDLLDRGPDSIKCLEFVNLLPKDRKILIKGNHEYLIEEAIARGYYLSHDYSNGTVKTVEQLNGQRYNDPNDGLLKVQYNKLLHEYLNSVIDYYETDKYIFVHGWIPCLKYIEGVNLYGEDVAYYEPLPSWRHANWESATWLNGMDCWKSGITISNKTILCGHWHCSWGNCYFHNKGVDLPKSINELDNWYTEPFIDNGIIAIDACTVLSGKVNCIKLGKQKKFDNEWRIKYL